MIITLFLLVPLIFVLRDSLLSQGRLSLANYYAIFTKRLYLSSFKTSLLLSLTTTAIGTLIGIPLSYVIYRRGPRAQDLLLSLTSIPLVFSGLVVGFSFIVILGSSGFITLILKKLFNINPVEFSAFLFTWKGLVIAYLYFLIPRMILTMTAAWASFDWNLLDAAFELGSLLHPHLQKGYLTRNSSLGNSRLFPAFRREHGSLRNCLRADRDRGKHRSPINLHSHIRGWDRAWESRRFSHTPNPTYHIYSYDL